jgi:hypothetical protein
MPSAWDNGSWDSGFWDEDGATRSRSKMNAKVALNLRGLDARQKLDKFQNAITKLTGNAAFPTPNPTLLAAQTAVDAADECLDLIAAKESELDQLRLARDQKVDAAMGLYASLGAYVENRAAGDPALIASAGFDVASPAAPTQPMPRVEGVALSTGDDEGTADAQWNAVSGAKSYEVQTSPNPITSTSWSHEATVTSSVLRLTGKPTGTKLWLRVRAINKLGPGAWSDPACVTVP